MVLLIQERAVKYEKRDHDSDVMFVMKILFSNRNYGVNCPPCNYYWAGERGIIESLIFFLNDFAKLTESRLFKHQWCTNA